VSLPKVDEKLKDKILAISKQSQERIHNLKAATAMSHFGYKFNRDISENLRYSIYDYTMQSGELSLLDKSLNIYSSYGGIKEKSICLPKIEVPSSRKGTTYKSKSMERYVCRQLSLVKGDYVPESNQ
jgi:hypothetical protein